MHLAISQRYRVVEKIYENVTMSDETFGNVIVIFTSRNFLNRHEFDIFFPSSLNRD